MREILFRGKCEVGYDYSDGDGWVYGSLLQDEKVVAIVKTEDIELCFGIDDGVTSIEDFACIPVDANTVGQYTGLKDKNRTKIFEGDIFMIHEGRDDYKKTYLIWNEDRGMFQPSNKLLRHVIRGFNYLHYEIIGNIYDNPELIEQVNNF